MESMVVRRMNNGIEREKRFAPLAGSEGTIERAKKRNRKWLEQAVCGGPMLRAAMVSQTNIGLVWALTESAR